MMTAGEHQERAEAILEDIRAGDVGDVDEQHVALECARIHSYMHRTLYRHVPTVSNTDVMEFDLEDDRP